MSYEEKMAKLTQIVDQLEAGNELSLEESLKIFEEGIDLANSCRKMLEEAELRVHKVMELNHETDGPEQAGASQNITE